MGMQKFWKIVEDVIKESDVVVEVLDARMPSLTRNKKAEKIVRDFGKPLILVVNKMDLIKGRHEDFSKLNGEIPSVFVSCRKRKGILFLKRKIFEVVKKRSMKRKITVGFIGYPNTGKSSLINALAGKKKARVAAKAGWTRGLQWINTDSLWLLDTPGVIPFSEREEAKKALMGIIDPSKIQDSESAAVEIIRILLKSDPKKLEMKYKIETEGDTPSEIIEKIGNSRKMLKKGGIIDERRVHLTLIQDWQKGKLV